MRKKLQSQSAQQLRDERLRYNWSQQELADHLGTTPVTVSRWENGVSAPSPYFRLKLEKLFGKSLETLESQAEENSVMETDSSKEELITDGEPLEKTTASLALTDQLLDDHQPEKSLTKAQANLTEKVLADTTAPPLLLPHQKQRLSRRSILLMIGGAGLTSIGVLGLIETSSRQNIATAPSAPQNLIAAHSSPTITTLYVYKPDGYNINYVAWSPYGTFLACADGDNTVQILNATTGGVRMIYRKHTGDVNCVTWSPDEAYVGSASGDSTVQIWKPITGEHVFTYTGHIGSVYCVVWSRSGARIASGGKDTKVQVWDPFTGQPLATYHGHTKGVWNVVWSPDDASIASGGEDGTIQVWDSRTAQKSPTFVYQGPQQSRISEIDWSPDGYHIASAHIDGTVHIWDALTGSPVLTYARHTTPVITARYSPNGLYIASASQDGQVHIWEVSSGRRIFTYNKHTKLVYEVAWAPDSKRLATGGSDQMMYVCKMNF